MQGATQVMRDDEYYSNCTHTGTSYPQHVSRMASLSLAQCLSVNMSKTQVVIFNDLRHSHSGSFLYSHQQLQTVEQYTYLGIVLHKGGFYKHAISMACTQCVDHVMS